MGSKGGWKIWALVALGLFIGFLAVPELGGRLLSARHVVSSSVLLNETPETVWKAITDFASAPSWRNEVITEERLPDRDGHPVWKEKYRNGQRVSFETVESCAPYRLVRTMVDSEMLRERWQYELVPTKDGTELRITEVGEIPSPFMRFVSKYVMGHPGSVNSYQKALAIRFGETPHIMQSPEIQEQAQSLQANIPTTKPCGILSASVW